MDFQTNQAKPMKLLPKASDWGGSRLKLAQSCKKKYWWSHVYEGKGLASNRTSLAVSFGVLVHYGLQHFYMDQEGDAEQRTFRGIKAAVELLEEIYPLESGKEDEKALLKDEVIACLDQYFQKYSTDELVPLEVEKEEQVTLVGGEIHTVKLDLFAAYQGWKVVVDHKTTSKQWDTFFKQFRDDLSLKGYAYLKRKQTGENINILINGIRRKKNKAFECEFQREPIFYTEQEMDEFEKTVVHIRKEIDLCAKEDFYPKTGEQCVTVYGECEFRKLCTFNGDEAIIKTFYRRKE